MTFLECNCQNIACIAFLDITGQCNELESIMLFFAVVGMAIVLIFLFAYLWDRRKRRNSNDREIWVN